MLRDEVKLFEKLSGESANDVTIVRLGSFLDGYYIGKEETVIHAHKVRAHSQGGGTHWVVCSHCEKPIDWQDAYCKHCGAKMDEEVPE